MEAEYIVRIEVYRFNDDLMPHTIFNDEISFSDPIWLLARDKFLSIFEQLQNSWKVPQVLDIADDPDTVKSGQYQYSYSADFIIDDQQIAHFGTDLSEEEQLVELQEEYLAYNREGQIPKSVNPVTIFDKYNQCNIEILPGLNEVLIPKLVTP